MLAHKEQFNPQGKHIWLKAIPLTQVETHILFYSENNGLQVKQLFDEVHVLQLAGQSKHTLRSEF